MAPKWSRGFPSNIRDPNEVYELVRKAWLAARKKYGLSFREEM